MLISLIFANIITSMLTQTLKPKKDPTDLSVNTSCEEMLAIICEHMSQNIKTDPAADLSTSHPKLFSKQYLEKEFWPYLVENITLLGQNACVHNYFYALKSLPVLEQDLELLSFLHYQLWRGIENSAIKDELLIRLIFETNNWLSACHNLLSEGEPLKGRSYLELIHQFNQKCDLLDDYLISFRDLLSRIAQGRTPFPELLKGVEPCISILLQTRKYRYLLSNEILEEDTTQATSALRDKAEGLQCDSLIIDFAQKKLKPKNVDQMLNQIVTKTLTNPKSADDERAAVHKAISECLQKKYDIADSGNNDTIQLSLKTSSDTQSSHVDLADNVKSLSTLLTKLEKSSTKGIASDTKDMMVDFEHLQLIFESMLLYQEQFTSDHFRTLTNSFEKFKVLHLKPKHPLSQIIGEKIYLFKRSCVQIAVAKMREQQALNPQPSPAKAPKKASLNLDSANWQNIIGMIIAEKDSKPKPIPEIKKQTLNLLDDPNFEPMLFAEFLEFTKRIAERINKAKSDRQKFNLRQTLCESSFRVLSFIDDKSPPQKIAFVNIICIESIHHFIELNQKCLEDLHLKSLQPSYGVVPKLWTALNIYIRTLPDLITMSVEQPPSEPLVWQRTIQLVQCMFLMEDSYAYSLQDLDKSLHGRRQHLLLAERLLNAIGEHKDVFGKLAQDGSFDKSFFELSEELKKQKAWT